MQLAAGRGLPNFPDLVTYFSVAAKVLAGATDLRDLNERRTEFLGRERGTIKSLLAVLPQLPLSMRKSFGSRINQVKTVLEEVESTRRKQIEEARESRTVAGLDVTLPGRKPWVGRRHVLAQLQDELLDLFHGLGYSVYTSPEVELDEYNFGKLNFAPDHPARDAHDTYFVDPAVLLRTHTSPGWVRAMEQMKPPLRLVFPGRVYRAEQVDASHMDQFHQMDGLCVGPDISMADLKGTLATFAHAIYGRGVRTRFIPIYFPFVEPGAQLDVSCVICGGSGVRTTREGSTRCAVCKGSGWLEVLGSGMVHPNVFRAVGYDPEKVTGFAFGMGLERIAMLRHDVPEIRLFLENDLRFLGQFPA
ncbi:MAG: phenylalanine--tRNA ligase subunit alpha [Candidatus Eisenbacteria bacterium]